MPSRILAQSYISTIYVNTNVLQFLFFPSGWQLVVIAFCFDNKNSLAWLICVLFTCVSENWLLTECSCKYSNCPRLPPSAHTHTDACARSGGKYGNVLVRGREGGGGEGGGGVERRGGGGGWFAKTLSPCVARHTHTHIKARPLALLDGSAAKARASSCRAHRTRAKLQ